MFQKWKLVCENAVWRSNMQSIYFSGISIGSVVMSKLAKRFYYFLIFFLLFSFVSSFRFNFCTKRLGQRPVLISSLMLILFGFFALSFGPQKIYGTQISYLILVSGRFLIAMGSYGVSINGYLLGILFVFNSISKIN